MMNRIILIGNGFDLAHGMPTDYVSFIKWYLKQCFKEANSTGEYEGLLNINRTQDYPGILEEEVERWVEECYTSGLDLAKLGTTVSSWDARKRIYPFSTSINSS